MAKTPRRQLGRVPDAEWEAFREAAEAEGLPLSQWIRRALRQVACHEDIQRKAARPAWARLVGLRTTRTMPGSGDGTRDSPEG